MLLIAGMLATPSLQQNVEAPVFNPATVREFTPQNYDLANSVCTGPDPDESWTWRILTLC